MKQDKTKEQVVAQLKEMPIVQIVCKKLGIGRATYYRWRNEDKEFQKATDEAIREGELLINDMSESQVVNLIREKNWPAISFWLKHHHPKYANKVEVIAQINQPAERLTPEQEAVVREALRLAAWPEHESPELKIHDQKSHA